MLANFLAGIEQWCAQWLVPPATELNAANTAGAIEGRLRGGLGSSQCPRSRSGACVWTASPGRGRTDSKRVRSPYPTIPRQTPCSFCTALTESTRRWYAQCSGHDATVQANLARLAVLR